MSFWAPAAPWWGPQTWAARRKFGAGPWGWMGSDAPQDAGAIHLLKSMLLFSFAGFTGNLSLLIFSQNLSKWKVLKFLGKCLVVESCNTVGGVSYNTWIQSGAGFLSAAVRNPQRCSFWVHAWLWRMVVDTREGP